MQSLPALRVQIIIIITDPPGKGDYQTEYFTGPLLETDIQKFSGEFLLNFSRSFRISKNAWLASLVAQLVEQRGAMLAD